MDVPDEANLPKENILVESRTEPQYPSAVLMVRSVMAVSMAERKAVGDVVCDLHVMWCQ